MSDIPKERRREDRRGTDARVTLLEHQADILAQSAVRMEKKLDDIGSTLQSLVRIEERQISINERLAEGARTMREHEEQLKRIELSIPKELYKRLSDIEIAMPGLKEGRKWLVAGVLGVLGMVGIALLQLLRR